MFNWDVICFVHDCELSISPWVYLGNRNGSVVGMWIKIVLCWKNKIRKWTLGCWADFFRDIICKHNVIFRNGNNEQGEEREKESWV